MWVNNHLFKEEIQKYHPLSYEYKEYWKEQTRRCIEGHWIAGRWCPGNLYYYINFGTILANVGNSTSKVKRRPDLWDILWEINYSWNVCRGFVGFNSDPTLQSFKEEVHKSPAEQDEEKIEMYKTYAGDPRDWIESTTKDLGKPIYCAEAKNFLWIAARDCGKSYMAAAIAAHEFTFNGARSYEEFINNPPQPTVTIGAEDSAYSSLLCKKTQMILENHPGEVKSGSELYPAPFYKRTSGTWNVGGKGGIRHEYKVYQDGHQKNEGSGAWIRHVSYKDDDFAAQGSRNSILIKEEIGHFANFETSFEPDRFTLTDSGYQFGSSFMMGTGGDMDKGTIGAQKMFYNPEAYNIITFEDQWEGRGKIAYFTPAVKSKHRYKDKNGNTRYDYGQAQEDKNRAKAKNSKNSAVVYDNYVQYHPGVPSEAFLQKHGNIFPRKELQDWLAILESNEKFKEGTDVVQLLRKEDGSIGISRKHHDRPILHFPHDATKDDLTGALVIWEHPVEDMSGKVPYGLYVAGTDPYAHDEAGTPSLGSTIVYKKFYKLGAWENIPVAEYTGRPTTEEYYDNVRLILEYYNARCLYENNIKGLYQHFKHKTCTHLLMDQPGYIKDIVQKSTVHREKGMHMVEALKVHGEQLIAKWLVTEYSPGKLNVYKLRSPALVKELIQYNRKHGNFDRTMAFMLVMYAVQETMLLDITQAGEEVESSIRKFTNMKDRMFRNSPAMRI